MKKKVLSFFIAFMIIINILFPVFADDDLDETSISEEEMEEILQTAGEVLAEPIINSRYAVCFDRTSR